MDIASVGNPDGVDAALESIEPLDIVITLVTSDKPYRDEIMSLDLIRQDQCSGVAKQILLENTVIDETFPAQHKGILSLTASFTSSA
jgi:hypothetical protein